MAQSGSYTSFKSPTIFALNTSENEPWNKDRADK